MHHNCNVCGKKYTRKSSQEKHVILCEILSRTDRERKIESEEYAELPSKKQLFVIIQELAYKYNKLEEKVTEMQKCIVKKREKIKMTDWLEKNTVPGLCICIYSFTEKILESINENIIGKLMECSLVETIGEIFREHRDKNTEFSPLQCFEQKHNTLYVYSKSTWKEQTGEEFYEIINKIHNKIIDVFCEWKTTNKTKIKNEDIWTENYNKLIMKIMTISLKESTILGKIKKMVFNHFKRELEMIEYEVE